MPELVSQCPLLISMLLKQRCNHGAHNPGGSYISSRVSVFGLHASNKYMEPGAQDHERC